MQKILCIGMDFHGVAVNIQLVKQKAIWQKTGRLIPLGWIKREMLISHGAITAAEYDEINIGIHEQGGLLEAPPYPGFLRTVFALIRAGHRLDIVTASNPDAFQNAVLWCGKYEILASPFVRLLGSGRDGDKTDIMAGVDAYLDDDLAPLRRMRERGIPAAGFLLSRPYNLHDSVQDIAERVAGFHTFRRRITQLANT